MDYNGIHLLEMNISLIRRKYLLLENPIMPQELKKQRLTDNTKKGARSLPEIN